MMWHPVFFVVLLLSVPRAGRGLLSLPSGHSWPCAQHSKPACAPLQAVAQEACFGGDGEFVDRIRLQNWAVFESIDLDLGGRPGFMAITGETGSGKSMIIKALEYCAGAGKKKTSALHLFTTTTSSSSSSSSSSATTKEDETRVDIVMKPQDLVCTDSGATVGIRSDRLYSRVVNRGSKKSYVHIDGRRATGVFLISFLSPLRSLREKLNIPYCMSHTREPIYHVITSTADATTRSI